MATSTWDDSVDHLDPLWEEGRDYQLICGLHKPVNLRLCSVGENSKKSNRFTPWRVDTKLPPPENPGDWAWFLNLETGEWEFTQWLGSRWNELTRTTCGEHQAGKNRKGKPYSRDPSVPSNFVDYHLRRKEDPKLNENFLETCRRNGKTQGAINGKKNKGRKHTAEVNLKKGSPGELNGMHGKVRITNGEHNTQINKGDSIPEGYWAGLTRHKQVK
jgi:hypothetical protein